MTQKKHKPYPKSKIVDDDKHFLAILGIGEEPTEDHIWTTVEGESIYFKDLRKSHIINILHFMDKRPGWRSEQRPHLEAELKKREQRKLARKTVAGKLFYVD